MDSFFTCMLLNCEWILNKCSFGFLVIRPCWWCPFNWGTSHSASIDLLSRGWFIGEQRYENSRFMSVGLLGVVHLVLYCLAWLRPRKCNFVHFCFKSNELRGPWNILYSELQLGSKLKRLDSWECQLELADFDLYVVINNCHPPCHRKILFVFLTRKNQCFRLRIIFLLEPTVFPKSDCKRICCRHWHLTMFKRPLLEFIVNFLLSCMVLKWKRVLNMCSFRLLLRTPYW